MLVSAQKTEKLSFEKLNKQVNEYLSKNDDIYIMLYKRNQIKDGSVSIIGVHNRTSDGDVVNGVYSFSMNVTMSKGYFLIVDDNEVTVLDITNRDKLDKSIKLLLDFCDKYNYCETIVTDYVSRLTRVYYNLNKWKGERKDLNCINGISDTKKLP